MGGSVPSNRGAESFRHRPALRTSALLPPARAAKLVTLRHSWRRPRNRTGQFPPGGVVAHSRGSGDRAGGYAGNRAASAPEALRESARTSTVSFNRPAGTCRAGEGEGAVVDALLRVHGVVGLRVADASVMPSPPPREHPRSYGQDRRAGGRTPASDLDTGLRQPGERPLRQGGAASACRTRAPSRRARAGSRRACVVRSASGFGPVIAGSRG
ncbi:GMC oxidoreductase [Streptomyces globisporus]|uniref:GMC oxidoreductase n=1 Tax=Streptomyces globisporus TaxID=1908 RepID=UPI0036F5F669